MNHWVKLLLVSLPLAVALTVAFRFIQHTDHEYAFWVATFGAVATQLEARCGAAQAPDVCTRAAQRRAIADEFRMYRDAVMAWWWPVLVPMMGAWAAAAVAALALLARFGRRGVTHDPPRERSGS
jgi:hypothetical protein